MTTDPLAFYAQQSTVTNPGSFATCFDNLPDDLDALHQIVQNLYIHIWKIRKHQPGWLKTRSHEIESHTVAHSLQLALALDDRPITVERSREKKLIIDCRHFATLLCSLLRHKGIPARVRCGFATYLEKTHYQDHWTCEYWNGERWVMEDPDLKMHDVPLEQFITGGKAWQMIKAGEVTDIQFGYDPHERGEWVVVHDLVRDLAALNGYEMLSSDSWGVMDKKVELLTRSERALLDEAARWSLAPNSEFDGIRAFYEGNVAVRVPETVTLYNYVTNKPRPYRWNDREVVSG